MSDEANKPSVLIVGAGLGGVLLGALLEKANVSYTIFERASSVKPLGSAMSIGSALIPVFRQLGCYDEFVAIGKRSIVGETWKESTFGYSLDFLPREEFSGELQYIVPRPLLYNILVKLIPPHKIQFGKRVLMTKQTEDNQRVTIQTSDNAVYEGDILVGADGAYSAVRQRLYETLQKEGKLPESDQEELPFSCTCLVGQTLVLDLDEFPQLKDPLYPFISTLGNDKPYSWVLFGTAEKKIAWMVVEHLSSETTKMAQEQRFRNSDNSEWGPTAAQSMCDETRKFPIAFGNGKMNLGDLYDRTPKELISKVMLEEKVFKTWYHGRTVLLGDACHKLHPAGGLGAVTSMHDAIALANLIYCLPSTSTADVSQMFSEYKTERLPPVTAAFNSSRSLAKSMEKGLAGTIAFLITKYMPVWLWRIFLKGMVKNRLRCGYLTEIEDKGTVPAAYSASYEKARALYNKRREAESPAAPVTVI
ncbi:hypothetical protein EC957_005620 [Mortierella hygrophila]|uniref:FAD-binding domain-containing protein n=1 Tax=Mortierella hygrophila TaxID=979708 RepID=A0A9P6F0P2_9FUNG|nr:hypothetical protein EC957_005620 [Mortierella hygrophila]